MRKFDWIYFWSPQKWKDWRSSRPQWAEYQAEKRRLTRSIVAEESRLTSSRVEMRELEQRLEWAQEVSPCEIPIKTGKSETGLAAVDGVTLLEIRKQQGNKVWTSVDAGTVYFTDKQAVFSGAKDVKFNFARLKSADLTGRGLQLSVSTRRASHILAGPAPKLAALLAASQSVAAGEDALAPFATRTAAVASTIAVDEERLDQLQSERSGLAAPPRPVSPAWAPLAILLVLGFVGSALAEPSPKLELASGSTTTTSVPATETTRPQETTTSTAPTTTATGPTLPPVASAAVIFAPIFAGESGDPAAPLISGAETVTVDSITDGDTIRARFADGTTEPLRLIGINTPESNECWAPEAALALTILIPVGTEIGITVDVSERDQFDRLLRYLWVGTFSVNEEMVRRGAAISRRYPPDTALADRFEAAQAAAQGSQLGLWAPDACGPPADASLSILNLFYDAPGNDNENLNEEWIRIRNDGDNLVDMTDWGIKDESASNRYLFPVGFVLAPGEYVTVYSGCGNDFGLDLYWCSVGSAIWNNDGDTAFLTDPNGNTHTSKAYVPPTTTTQASTTTSVKSAATTTGGGNCHPSYPDVCIPPAPPDLNCGDISYRNFRVTGSDPHNFDGNNDGRGCES